MTMATNRDSFFIATGRYQALSIFPAKVGNRVGKQKKPVTGVASGLQKSSIMAETYRIPRTTSKYHGITVNFSTCVPKHHAASVGGCQVNLLIINIFTLV